MKKKIQEHEQELSALYQKGTLSSEVLRQRSQFYDNLILELLQKEDICCIIATGSYGRQEMNKHSDLDLQVLHKNLPPAVFGELDESFLRPLERNGLKIAIMNRDIGQPIEKWNFNLHEQTVFFETRHICGSRAIYNEWKNLLENYWLENNHRQKLFRSVKQDYENFLKTCLNNPQEPDLKRDAGGIREYTFLYWLTAIAGKTIPQVLNPEESKIFRQALEFLWLLRDVVHHVSGRDENKLTKDLQTRLPMTLNLEKLQILMQGLHKLCFASVQAL